MPRVLLLQKNRRVGWKVPFSDSELEALFQAMLAAGGFSFRTVELAILDDASMTELHQQSLGCEGPTNILSFPAFGNADEASILPNTQPGNSDDEIATEGFLGWLALSADTLHRECLLYGQDIAGHCLRLFAHGLAHLMGHDHGPAMDALCRELEKAGTEVSLQL